MRHTLLSCLILALGSTACATKSASTVTTTEGTGAPRPAPVARAPEAPAPREEASLEPEDFGPIFYTLDSSRLTPESQQTLERLAQALRRHPQARVTIAGHTCELGTTEYNLALGQQRAAVARDYLVRLGVEAPRVQLRSYGEESPRAAGTSEAALRENRRSEFTFALQYASRSDG